MTALIYGGSGSGKSEFAERMIEASPAAAARIYIATMSPEDDESRRRIAKHRINRRRRGFVTVERYTDLAGLSLPAGGQVLLECLGNLVANEIFSPNGAGKETFAAVARGVEEIAAVSERLVVVSNDVFSDGSRFDADTELYRDTLAALNRRIAAAASLVVETVAGIPIRHKP